MDLYTIISVLGILLTFMLSPCASFQILAQTPHEQGKNLYFFLCTYKDEFVIECMIFDIHRLVHALISSFCRSFAAQFSCIIKEAEVPSRG